MVFDLLVITAKFWYFVGCLFVNGLFNTSINVLVFFISGPWSGFYKVLISLKIMVDLEVILF